MIFQCCFKNIDQYIGHVTGCELHAAASASCSHSCCPRAPFADHGKPHTPFGPCDKETGGSRSYGTDAGTIQLYAGNVSVAICFYFLYV